MIEPALYNKLYKRELFENVRLNESLKINEDLDVNYRLFKKSQKSIYYDLPLYSYMIRKNSATGSNTVIRKNEDSLKVLEQIKNDCKSEKEIYSIAYRRYVYLLMDDLSNGYRSDNISEVQKRYSKERIEKQKILNNIYHPN
mgnify:CR=1 FL=1